MMKKVCKLLLMFFVMIVSIGEVKALSYNSYLDNPVINTVVGDSLYVQGWVMSDDVNSSLELYIDGLKQECEILRYEREDVISAIKGYGGIFRNPTPGFKTNIDLSKLNLSNSIHKLEVKVLSESGMVVRKMTTNFKVDDELAKMYLDYPSTNALFGDKVIIDGWLMSTNSRGKFKVFLGDIEVPYTIKRTERRDVQEAISGYGDSFVNKTPGFVIEADVSGVQDGNYQLSVQYVDLDKVLASNSKKIKIEKDKIKMYLDSPSTNIDTTSVNVSGWLMSTNKDIKLELYVDNISVDVGVNRTKRTDVQKAVFGYGDEIINPLPGFDFKLDMSKFLNGKHEIKVIAKNTSDVVIAEIKKIIYLDKYKSDMYIDSPSNNILVNGIDVNVSGWSITNVEDTKIMVSVDDNEEIEVVNRSKRDDVVSAYYGKYDFLINKLPGFSVDLDMSKYVDGVHTIFVRVYDKNTGELISEKKKTISLDKYNSNMYIDSPDNNIQIDGVNLGVDGWFLTDSRDYSIKLFVDDEELETEVLRHGRDDVIKVYSSLYDTEINKLAGFKIAGNLDKIKDGKHVVIVKAIDNLTNELLISKSKTIMLKKYKSKAYIESPSANQFVKGIKMNVGGWFMSTSPDNYLKFYIDGKEVIVNIDRIKREDVVDKYGSEYGVEDRNILPGYNALIDLEKYSDGEHFLEVKSYDKKTNEVLINSKVNFNLKKYEGIITVDYPEKSNYSNTVSLTIQGWEMSEVEDSVIKVFFDDKELEVVRYERDDVLNAHPNLYGGLEKNKLPGFMSTMSLNGVSSGEHDILIKLYSRFGDLLTISSKKIIVYDKLYFGIDVSSHQGRINWDEVNRSGVDFAIIRLGVGDNFLSQDDIEFWNNVNGCVKNNIPFGVYLYSYATNLNGGSDINQDSASIDSEIAHTLRVLGNFSQEQREMMKLPVFIDMEDDSTKFIGKSGLTSMADYYCTNIEKNGYECGIYANKNWLDNYLDNSYLGSKYDVWLAHYTNDYNNLSSYNGSYQLWQYTSSGHISGITSNGLDMNVSFKKYW